MFIKIYPENPNIREVEKVVQILQNDGIIIYPTDTVYAMGCSLQSKKAFSQLLRIKGIDEKKANFSLLCSSLSHLSDYAKVDNSTFKLLKKNLPGPFTFILPASNKVPDKILNKRKTIGLRIPDNSIVKIIIEMLNYPLLSTSIKSDDEILEYVTDPELIYSNYKNQIDALVDGGNGGIEPSTVVDCTGNELEIIRQGKGELIY